MYKPKPPIKQKYVKTPQDLWDMWKAYKSNVDNNPDYEAHVTVKGEIVMKPKRRPYLQEEFYVFVYENYGFHVKQYFDRKNPAYASYLDVTTHIVNERNANQLSGTLTGTFKSPQITSKLCGLIEENKEDKLGYTIPQITIKYESNGTGTGAGATPSEADSE